MDLVIITCLLYVDLLTHLFSSLLLYIYSSLIPFSFISLSLLFLFFPFFIFSSFYPSLSLRLFSSSSPLLHIFISSPQICQWDEVVVDVVNELGSDSTTVHWHGIHQRGTPFMDGVPFLTQCPIPAGTTFR